MGSDDLFSDNSLGIMIKTINTYNSRLILCNRDWIEKLECKNWISDYKVMNFSWFSDFSTYLWYQNKDTYHKDTYFTFMSSHVFNKKYFNESYEFVVRDLGFADDMIKHHYFNHSFIWFMGIKDSDIII